VPALCEALFGPCGEGLSAEVGKRNPYSPCHLMR
jgi:hypothetical protein